MHRHYFADQNAGKSVTGVPLIKLDFDYRDAKLPNKGVVSVILSKIQSLKYGNPLFILGQCEMQSMHQFLSVSHWQCLELSYVQLCK